MKSSRLSFLKRSPLKTVIRLTKQDAEGRHFYTTGDHIDGVASVITNKDIEIEGIQILLQGSGSLSTKAKHVFLSMHQPMENMGIPIPKVLKTGRVYSFEFQFTVPDRLLPHICRHIKQNRHVSEAHLLLPPSMGKTRSRTHPASKDGLSPSSVETSYSICVSLFTPSKKGHPSHRLSSMTKPVWIIPTVYEQPPIGHSDSLLYCVHREIVLKRGLWNGISGRLFASALQPNSLSSSATGLGMERKFEAMASLELEFFSHALQKPPELKSMAAKLVAITFHSSRQWEDFPDASFGEDHFGLEDRNVYRRSINLSEVCLKSQKWAKSTGDLSSNCYKTVVQIPITSPRDRLLTPTFHSCLVSRIYLIELSLSYYIPGAVALTSSLNLRVPIQVTN
ncbi:hypothetical protein BO79DRAFT_153844 [Aspergillus costaricaensis CBS 115574]|uniref:Uncharacterized protein n=1 Tax=Aspergillus costaricaensis CBS 115574 TaxID=1448317 RepID=A0ACD1I750_9EURO|nr:hypothetical protein BO79DRAFT_153844 [Aspergillus costaricaensis CBS 115574]RAK86393.1 hypothetical protein BO79DRAFT_153844 [Aspergillus costaricaensis CBS 115574]